MEIGLIRIVAFFGQMSISCGCLIFFFKEGAFCFDLEHEICLSDGMRFVSVVSCSLVVLLAGCVTVESEKARAARVEKEKIAGLVAETTAAHDAFRQSKGWKSRAYTNPTVLATITPENVSVRISLSEQRGYLLRGTLIAMDFPVATGRSGHPTPKGEYKIRQKEVKYSSNLYGAYVDIPGEDQGAIAVTSGGSASSAPVPPVPADTSASSASSTASGGTGESAPASDGGVATGDAAAKPKSAPKKFVGVSMPYWMRLTDDGIGMHVGYVPCGRPASHGCIRIQHQVAPEVFKRVKIGTPVVIADGGPEVGSH